VAYGPVVARQKLLRSGHCLRDAHQHCPHFSDIEVGVPWRPRPRADHVLTLCECDCHATCPLAGQGTAVRAVWLERCACPGAGLVQAAERRAEDRRRQVGEVLAAARREGRLSSADLESRLREVYLARGEAPPPGLAGWARIAAVGTAPRGTRSPRLVWMGVRSLARTVRWAWQPVAGSGGHNRAETRRLYRAMSVVALIAALLTAASVRSSGRRRLGFALGALLAWLAALWGTTLGSFVAGVARFAEERPASDEGGDRATP
jgi:hypothetical protein